MEGANSLVIVLHFHFFPILLKNDGVQVSER
jgi:hypothetical protein